MSVNQTQTSSPAQQTPSRRPRSYSPTALGMFQDCPKQYEFAYILKPSVREAPSPHLVLGNALHQALAFVYRLPIEDRNEAAAHRALRHHWAQMQDRSEAFLDEEEGAWGRRGLEALTDYCQRYDLGIRPLGIEEWIRARLPNGRLVVGKADRVDRARGVDAGVEIVDYKTGKCRIEDDEVHDLLAARLYALAPTRTYRQPVVRVRFLYVTEGVERSWSPQNEDLAAIEDELVELTDRVAETTVFVPQPEPTRCRWCKFAPLCPAKDESSLAELTAAEDVAF